MEQNNLYLKTESNINTDRIYPLYSIMLNLKQKNFNIKKKLDYTKLRINKNILKNIIKRSNLKKLHKKSLTHTKLEFFNKKKNLINPEFKASYDLNKKFHELPSLSKFTNITCEKINYLIKSTDINNNKHKNSNSYNFNSYLYNKTRRKIDTSSNDNNNLRNKTTNFIRNYSDKEEYFLYNKNKDKSNNNYMINNVESKLFKLKLKKLNSNKTPNNTNLHDTKNSVKGLKHNSYNKIKLNIVKKIVPKSATKRWIDSIKDSLNNYNFTQRQIKNEKMGKFNELSEKCCDEIDVDEKSEDKFAEFKNQLNKHKNKLEQIIREIKKTQVNNEYLMKKYIFELLTKKKM